MSPNRNMNKTIPRRYTEEQIRFVLDRALRAKLEDIQADYNKRFGDEPASLSQIKYIRFTYGRDPHWGAILIRGAASGQTQGSIPQRQAGPGINRTQTGPAVDRAPAGRASDRFSNGYTGYPSPVASQVTAPAAPAGQSWTDFLNFDNNFDFNTVRSPSAAELQANAGQLLLPPAQGAGHPRRSNAVVNPRIAPVNPGQYGLLEPGLESPSQVFMGLGDNNGPDQVVPSVEMPDPGTSGQRLPFAGLSKPRLSQSRLTSSSEDEYQRLATMAPDANPDGLVPAGHALQGSGRFGPNPHVNPNSIANLPQYPPARVGTVTSPEFIQPAQMPDPFRSPSGNVTNPGQANFADLDFSDLLGQTFDGVHGQCYITVRHRHDRDGGLHFDSAADHQVMIDQLYQSVRTQVMVEEMGARIRMQQEIDNLRAVNEEMAATIAALRGDNGAESGPDREGSTKNDER